MAEESIDTAQISIDDEGRVVIDSPALAEALRARGGQGQLVSRLEPGTNLRSCGNNC